MSTMTIRCDEADKKAAAEVAEYYGFDLSSVTRAFWKQIGRTKRIPLELGYGEPNEESLDAIRETQKMIAAGGPTVTYGTAKDLLAAAKA